MIKKIDIKKVTLSGLLATFSLLLSFIGHYLVIPMFLGFKLDLSDFPIFTSTLLFGSSYGYTILFVVSFIRIFSFSIAGWPGFFMRMVSVISVFFLGLYFKKKRRLFLYSVLSIIFYIILKIPVSYIFWTKFNLMPPNVMNSMVLPVILPYNFVKTSINVVISILFYKRMKKKIKE